MMNISSCNLQLRLGHTFLLLLLSYSVIHAQAPVKLWDKRFGGSGSDAMSSLQQGSDNGYILGGYSYSGISGDKSEDCWGDNDYWVVKIDSAGTKQWDKRFGGDEADFLSSVQQTSEGGYILGGYSNSGMIGDKSDVSRGSSDYWVVKISNTGVKEWDKTFGGSQDDALGSMQQTTDGGYILGGAASSDISGDKSENSRGYQDFWVVKISSTGAKEWDKTFGGDGMDYLYSLQQTADGGYILGGFTQSGLSGDKSENSQGGEDFWVVKISSTGVKEWDKRFGGNGFERLYSLQQTTDGGYILGGYSNSNISGDKSENSRGDLDYWVVKISSTGVKEWDKTFGGSGIERIRSLQQTSDGGYVLGGYTDSDAGGDKSDGSRGDNDYWIVKINNSGIKEWDVTMGGNGNDGLQALQQTVDGSYMLGGFSNSDQSGDKSQNTQGNTDYWVVKIGEASLNTISTAINTTQNAVMNVYPNPVKAEKLQINFSNLRPGVYYLSLYTVTGQKIATRTFNNGSGTVDMDIEALSQGMYQLVLTNEKAEKIAESKLIKQ